MECAPTGGNFRSEKFSIISDPDKIKELSDAVEIEMIKLFGDQLEATKAKNHSVVYYDAPHIIFVTSPYDNVLANYNMGNIVTYGRLAAQALGLGTCWNGMTQLAIQSNPKIKKLANIKGRIVGAFTIGYPKAKFYRVAPRRMKEVEGLHDVID
jgi:nitroreductase